MATTDTDVEVAIIGAGISGLATSYHLGHRGAVVFERRPHYGGHTYSELLDGFTWDDGPHVSFASNAYVKAFLEEMVGGEFESVRTRASNWYQGHWIDHPAQANLAQVPEPLRTQCLDSFLATRDEDASRPRNYREWLHQAFGPVFADTFPAAYTRKYWTADPEQLDTDWVGNRVLKPDVDQVLRGARGESELNTVHYLAKSDARYPTRGGFLGYLHKMAEGAELRLGQELVRADLGRRRLRFADGGEVSYHRLVSTMAVKDLVRVSEDAPAAAREAAERLRCTSFLRLDVAVGHPSRRDDSWLYVYDEDKLSTRISFTERFSPNNAPAGTTGIQVEVYGSEYRPLPDDHDEVKRRVLDELLEMGLVDDRSAVRYVSCRHVPQGNPIFDLARKEAMATIEAFLDRHGVLRVGRYGEWKYLMTDACIISARRAASRITGGDDQFDQGGVSLSGEG